MTAMLSGHEDSLCHAILVCRTDATANLFGKAWRKCVVPVFFVKEHGSEAPIYSIMDVILNVQRYKSYNMLEYGYNKCDDLPCAFSCCLCHLLLV